MRMVRASVCNLTQEILINMPTIDALQQKDHHICLETSTLPQEYQQTAQEIADDTNETIIIATPNCLSRNINPS